MCPSCQVLCELIDPETRCPYCISDELLPNRKICHDCLKRSALIKVSAAFDALGPPKALLSSFKNGNVYLAKGLAGYLAIQLSKLDWPFPDVIAPVPFSLSRRLRNGYNPRMLIAEELGKILNVPVINLLKRVSPHTEPPEFISMEKNINDKSVLLIDDLWITGSTMRAAADALQAQVPGNIFGLVFCRSI